MLTQLVLFPIIFFGSFAESIIPPGFWLPLPNVGSQGPQGPVLPVVPVCDILNCCRGHCTLLAMTGPGVCAGVGACDPTSDPYVRLPGYFYAAGGVGCTATANMAACIALPNCRLPPATVTVCP